MTMSIRGRLMATLAVAIALVVAASAFIAHARFRVRLFRELDHELALEAREMLEIAQHDAGLLGSGKGGGILAEFEHVESSFYYEFLAPDGAVVMRSGNLDGKPIPRSAGVGDRDGGFETTLPDGRRGRGLRVTIEPDDWKAFRDAHPDLPSTTGASAQRATIFVATDPSDHVRLLDELCWSLVIAAFATVAVATAVVGFVVRRALLPLERLSSRAAAIQPSDLTVRFQNDRAPRELVPIHHRLNELLERVQDAFARERRFNSAVAHELRTPVAELKTLCEVATRWPATAEEHAATLQQAGDIAAQMETLIVRLLTLRRAEAGKVDLQHQEVDVAAIVKRGFEQVEPKTSARRLTVELDLQSIRMNTDPTLLSAIVGNLITNAVDHAPAEGRIRCTLERGARLRLQVSNAAPDLSAEDVPRIFEPFWRKDPARTDANHWGLGLALSRAFAEQLGLELSAAIDGDHILHLRLVTELPPAA